MFAGESACREVLRLVATMVAVLRLLQYLELSGRSDELLVRFITSFPNNTTGDVICFPFSGDCVQSTGETVLRLKPNVDPEHVVVPQLVGKGELNSTARRGLNLWARDVFEERDYMTYFLNIFLSVNTRDVASDKSLHNELRPKTSQTRDESRGRPPERSHKKRAGSIIMFFFCLHRKQAVSTADDCKIRQPEGNKEGDRSWFAVLSENSGSVSTDLLDSGAGIQLGERAVQDDGFALELPRRDWAAHDRLGKEPDDHQQPL